MIIPIQRETSLKLPPRPENFTDEALKVRPDYDGLLYWGRGHSIMQLPHLCYTWRHLEEAFEATRKPIGDLGACFSTLGLEGLLRGIDIVPVDVTLLARSKQYLSGIIGGFEEVLPYYRGQVEFPAGFEPSRLISQREFAPEKLLQHGDRVLQSALVTDIAEMQVPDRAFSITIAHESVPKHSATKEEFLHRQLPQILRVTELEARIFPLAMHKTSRDSLSEVYRFSRDEAALHAVARKLGFSFQLVSPYEFIAGESSPTSMGQPLLGIFTRH